MTIDNQSSTKNEEVINVTTVPAVIFIPDNTIKLEITAKTLNDYDEIIEVTSTLNTSDVIEACIDGSYWENENAVYTLTEKARKELVIE